MKSSTNTDRGKKKFYDLKRVLFCKSRKERHSKGRADKQTDGLIQTWRLGIVWCELLTKLWKLLPAVWLKSVFLCFILESLTTHWERPKPAVQQTYYSWQRDTDAVNVEMTSYALLTYQLRNDISKSLPIVRWLTSQRGSQGGFISTQVKGFWVLHRVHVPGVFSPLFLLCKTTK